MGWYRDSLFPACYDFLMLLGGFDRFRAEALEQAHGRVLEIGIGTGRNLGFYPGAVDELTGLEPNPGMMRQLQRRLKGQPREVRCVLAAAESMPFPARHFDCVVTTLTLCSLQGRRQALAEAQRVLKPDGRLLVFEHGISPDPRVARWQRRLSPLQRRLAAGCSLDVPVREELKAAGFDCAALEERQLAGVSKTIGHAYLGALPLC